MSALEWLLFKPQVCPHPTTAALLMQMASSPQLCRGAGQPGRTIGAVCELCQRARGACTGTHTCAVQTVNEGDCRGAAHRVSNCIWTWQSQQPHLGEGSAGLAHCERQSPHLALGLWAAWENCLCLALGNVSSSRSQQVCGSDLTDE